MLYLSFDFPPFLCSGVHCNAIVFRTSHFPSQVIDTGHYVMDWIFIFVVGIEIKKQKIKQIILLSFV